MKIFLVPTDFSFSARNAISYAAPLAKAMKAKLILFHSFQIQVPSPDFPIVSMTAVELKSKAEKILRKEAVRIRKQYRIIVEAHVLSGFYPSEEILRLSKKVKPDLVIMGMKEKGVITEVLVGSTATSVMRDIKIPVMIIPEKAKYIKPEKILLAFDYSTPAGKKVFSPLRKIAKVFQSEIYVVHVLEKEEKSPEEKAKIYDTLARSLNGLKHNYYFPKNKNLKSGIDTFLSKNKASLLAMVPHKHDLIERLFGKSKTRNLAFHTHIPLLALPDKYRRFPAYFI